VIMMDHPQNPRHPTPWFTRKNLLGAGLLMNGDLTLQPSETLSLKYGFLVLDKPLDPEKTESLYQAYLHVSNRAFSSS